VKAKSKTKQELLMEVKELRRRLDETEQMHSKATLNDAELDYLASFPQLNPSPVIQVDRMGSVHYSNPAAEALFPDLRKAGLNHPWLADLEKVAESQEIKSGSPYTREIKVGDSWYVQKIHPVLEGTRLRIYGFDISERKQVEQERERLRLKAENEKRRLEAVLEALPVGVAVTDIRGNTVRSNKAYGELWGSPRPKVESVDDYGAYKAWWSETGKPVALEEWASAQAVQKGQTVIGQFLEIQRFDGSRASVVNSGAPIFDEEGKIAGCAVAIQDITDLWKAEQALRESEARTTAILNSISDGFMTLDNNLVVTYFNQEAEHLLGRKRGDVLGRNLFEAFPEAKKSIFEEKYTWAVKEKKATAFETYFGIEPYENWYDVKVYPHEHGISVYFRVITDQKRAETAILKAKENFEILAETASRLLATEKPQELVNELCQKVMTYLDCDVFVNYLVDPTRQRLHLNAWSGIPERTAKEIEWLDYGVAVCGCAARDAARIVCENIPMTPDPRTELVKSFGIKAYACHPLLCEGQVIGTLSFGMRTKTAFTEDKLSVMKGVADQVATAMDRTRLIREIEQSRDELEKRVLERTKELERAGETLKAERQRFYDVLETLPSYVVLLTPDYHATFANRTFIERFGESHGRRCFEFLFGLSEPCEKCETYSVLKTMAPHGWEWTGPDGRIYSVFDFPFVDTDGSNLILEMGIDITEQKRAEEELKKKEEQIRLFASQYIAAQETERRRIAVELHDAIASSLAGIKFRIEKTGEDMKQGLFSVESMKDVSSSLAQTIGEVRRIMADLRPSILDDLGVLPALNWLCREYEKTYSQITIEKQIGLSEGAFPESLKIVMFRISQEALTNIAKHSKASLVNLSIQKAEDRLELAIQDNGHGFQTEEIERGVGLSTMRERAELTGGTFSVESAQGKGTTIRASWPLTL
jgi:PAS domain S-box-containing protein